MLANVIVGNGMRYLQYERCPKLRVHPFHGRVHDFRRCAPVAFTFFEPCIIAIYGGGAHVYGKCTLRVHKIKA